MIIIGVGALLLFIDALLVWSISEGIILFGPRVYILLFWFFGSLTILWLTKRRDIKNLGVRYSVVAYIVFFSIGAALLFSQELDTLPS